MQTEWQTVLTLIRAVWSGSTLRPVQRFRNITGFCWLNFVDFSSQKKMQLLKGVKVFHFFFNKSLFLTISSQGSWPACFWSQPHSFFSITIITKPVLFIYLVFYGPSRSFGSFWDKPIKNEMQKCIWDMPPGKTQTSQLRYEPRHEKTCFYHMRTIKAQICAVWSISS